MANIIRIKRRSSGGAPGAPTSLASAELAYNEQDDTLYYGKGDNSSGQATSIPAIAGSGAFVSLSGNQTVTGEKTFSGSVNLGSNTTAANPATDNNSNKVATTAFVLGQGSNTNPVINGSANPGSSNRFSRQDHVHPTDTTRAPNASPTFTGTPAAPTASVDTTTTQIATTAFVVGQASSNSPNALGAASSGISKRYSREDHVHTMPSLNQVGSPTAPVSLNSQKITGLAAPSDETDAVNKAYVDAIAQGISWKNSARAATTANISLSGIQTIDGVTLIADDRVLVKNQSSAFNNGIYVVSSGSWSRSEDADASNEVPSGTAIFVTEGTENGNKSWVLSTPSPITLGATNLSFTQMTGASSGETNTASNVGTNGVGVYDSKSSSDLRFRKINPASNKLSVTLNGQQVDIDIVQSNITGLGTIISGTWQGTAIGLGYGGTGSDLSASADGAIFKKSGSGFAAAIAGTDYLSPASILDGGTF